MLSILAVWDLSLKQEFRKVWQEINGTWDAEEIVWVYEFRVYQQKTEQRRLGS